MRRPWVYLLAGALFATACSNNAAPDSSELREAVLETSTSTSVTPPSMTTNPALAGLEGLIATTDRAGLQLIDPTNGVIEAEFAEDGFVTQPTWSRDGSQLVAMAFDSDPAGRLLLVDAANRTSRDVPARRPYFFFSWSSDGSLIAALGPGSVTAAGRAMTALDILDSDGQLVSSGTLEGNSVYIAWEPGGNSILVHQDDSMLLLDDPTDLAAVRLISSPGDGFQAASWILGTRSALITSRNLDGADLIRIDVDTGEEVDLGPTAGFVLIAVAPDGLTAALSHALDPEEASITIGFETGQSGQGIDVEPASEISAAVEVVNLLTGERTPVSDVAALWVEWNPIGDALIVLNIDLTWSVWADNELRTLVDTRPTDVFLSRYLFFSGQYNETPRLWSPDGSAITYSGATADDGDHFYVLPVRGDSDPMAIDLGRAHVAFWSPR